MSLCLKWEKDSRVSLKFVRYKIRNKYKLMGDVTYDVPQLVLIKVRKVPTLRVRNGEQDEPGMEYVSRQWTQTNTDEFEFIQTLV